MCAVLEYNLFCFIAYFLFQIPCYNIYVFETPWMLNKIVIGKCLDFFCFVLHFSPWNESFLSLREASVHTPQIVADLLFHIYCWAIFEDCLYKPYSSILVDNPNNLTRWPLDNLWLHCMHWSSCRHAAFMQSCKTTLFNVIWLCTTGQHEIVVEGRFTGSLVFFWGYFYTDFFILKQIYI